MTSENYDVESFGSVSEFIHRDSTVTPDLYLFDVMLPDGSGIALCQQIKCNTHYVGVPVIIMSAHAHLGHINDICQPDDFISKPFDIENVLEKIENIFI